MAKNIYETLDENARARFVDDNVTRILCALISRRSSTPPQQLVNDALDTVGLLYDKMKPRRNGHAPESIEAETATAH